MAKIFETGELDESLGVAKIATPNPHGKTLDNTVKKIRHIVDLENFSESATIDLLMALHCENRIPIMGTILEKNNLI